MSADEIASYLQGQRNAALASLGRDGFPHVVAMWFLPEPDRIVMWTYRRSQKAANLRREPRATFLVDDGDRYDRLRGVMVKGKAELIDDVARVEEIGHALHSRYGGAYGDDVEAYRAVVAQQAPKRIGILLPMADVVSWDFRKLS